MSMLKLCICLLFSLWLCCTVDCASSNLHVGHAAQDEAKAHCRQPFRNDRTWKLFSALPGNGWDNLRNKDMGRVADLSFSDCTFSDDGVYALPRNVILYARKESLVEVMSEIMDNYRNYKSTTSSSINADASGGFMGIEISGKLSQEYQRVKSISVTNKLKIGKAMLKYLLYTAKLQPDFKLSASLTNRLTDIVNALIHNQTKTARYLSDVVVRDFGTHVVTSVEAGGVLEKIDYFRNDTITTSNSLRSKFSASMSIKFHTFLGINTGKNSDATNADIRNYENSVRKTSLKSHGGPILGSKPKLDDWIGGLKQNLVPIDRDGEPLFAVISRRSLPNIPITFLLKLRKEVEDAVVRYYTANSVKGCLDPSSLNFDPVANLDGHCDTPKTKFEFAGVFQTCHETNPSAGLNLCNHGRKQKNPITGQYTCPEGYEPILLTSINDKRGRRCTPKTKTCWLFFTCDDGETCRESSTILKAYWCAARKGAKLQQQSGMVFGGAFANDGRFVNEITQTTSCSEFYKPYLIGRDIQVCLSMDFQSAARYRIPFAGFFSCKSGNPLANPARSQTAAFSGSSASTDSPKRCPDGFSQVTLDTIDGCAVMQCVKSHSGLRRLPVRRPPFEQPEYEVVDRPVVRVESHGWRWGYNFSTHTWSFLGFFGNSIEKDSPGNGVAPGSFSVGSHP